MKQEKILIISDSTFILDFSNTATAEIIYDFSNCSNKYELELNILGKTFIILAKNLNEVPFIKRIISQVKNLKVILSASNFWNFSCIIANENNSSINNNILFKIEILQNFEAKIYLNKSNEDFNAIFLKKTDSFLPINEHNNQLYGKEDIEDLIKELYYLLINEYIQMKNWSKGFKKWEPPKKKRKYKQNKERI